MTHHMASHGICWAGAVTNKMSIKRWLFLTISGLSFQLIDHGLIVTCFVIYRCAQLTERTTDCHQSMYFSIVVVDVFLKFTSSTTPDMLLAEPPAHSLSSPLLSYMYIESESSYPLLGSIRDSSCLLNGSFWGIAMIFWQCYHGHCDTNRLHKHMCSIHHRGIDMCTHDIIVIILSHRRRWETI